jgi:choline dehydrogenase-like flavoprotein
MLHGIQQAFKIHQAAGAEEVLFPHQSHARFKLRNAKVSPEPYLQGIRKWGWRPNQFALFTAHQMGTCAMGGDAKRHPFNPEGESRELKGLFIADGSALPTSAGVNPMLSIMALAGWVAKGM